MSGFYYSFEVKESPGKGLGVFTKEFIPKGSTVWSIDTCAHIVYTEKKLKESLKTMSEEDIKHTLNHAYGYNGKIYLVLGAAQYVNHSANGNLCESNPHTNACYASRDICPGEELLDDYSVYDTPQWYIDLCKLYSVESSKDVAQKYK